MRRSDTIAALATPPGRGGIAVVRVSGPDAFAVAEALTGTAPTPGRIRFAALRQGATLLDEGVVLAFRGPASYTGEDVVEFQSHGGTVTPRRILEACFACGARPARRGEFTERAFLNGKLDLDQAENVLNLIEAKTVRAADAALYGLVGRNRAAARALYERALELSGELEHALDVDEGELPAGFAERTGAKIEDLLAEIRSALRRAREGKLLNEGALVVLAGPPNVGKSSLLNALLEENRAIVSETPGTTRDAIEAWLDLEGWPVRLVDTAGLRETDDAIETEGVKRARALMARADVVLLLESADAKPSGMRVEANALRVWTKCDLKGAPAAALGVSSRTGEGLDLLRRRIVSVLEARAAEAHEAGGDSGAADRDDWVATCLEVQRLLTGVTPSDPVLAANAVRSAAERLGTFVGAVYSDDLLNRLFSRFCVGK